MGYPSAQVETPWVGIAVGTVVVEDTRTEAAVVGANTPSLAAVGEAEQAAYREGSAATSLALEERIVVAVAADTSAAQVAWQSYQKAPIVQLSGQDHGSVEP